MKSLFRAVVAGAMLMLCGAARADTAPPESAPCVQKTAGVACTYEGRSGTCTDTTCTKADMMSWDRDASPTPPTIQYPCRLCVTGSAKDASADAGAGDDGACAIGGRTASRVGPWLLAAAFSALLLVARRRRGKGR